MSGLLALLDDVVALAKIAATTLDDTAAQAGKAGAKAAGIVIDDAAVTPRYVTGLAAQRELPIIGRIALGSLKNKLLILLPAALILATFAPWAITPILMFGGFYLAFEGYEKLHHLIVPAAVEKSVADVPEGTPEARSLEDERVAGAIRTDFILSAEIMAIALNTITPPDGPQPALVTQGVVLAVVGLMMTLIVYGAVALIVKADDVGAWLARRGGPLSAPLGRALVRGMPPFLQILSFVGMIAMLWVGGGILIHSLAIYGFVAPEHFIHNVSDVVRSAIPVASGIFAWLTGTLAAAMVGVVAGAITAVVVGWVKPMIGAKATH
jgi:predicted DNA repair protein MutK